MKRIFKRGNVERIAYNDDAAKELESKKYKEITKDGNGAKKSEVKSNGRGAKKSEARDDAVKEEE